VRFYVLKKPPPRDKYRLDTEFLQIEHARIGEAQRCEKCGSAISMRQWLPPYEIELETWGTGFADFVVGIDDHIVSPRLMKVLSEYGITGFEGFNPVTIRRHKKHRRFKGEPPAYARVGVIRTSAAVDVHASGFKWRVTTPHVCPMCRLGNGVLQRFDRVIIEPQSWTGEDVFKARGLPGDTLVSQRFLDMWQCNDLTGIQLIPAEEHWYDAYPWENDERARHLLEMENDGTIREKWTKQGDFVRYSEATNECVISKHDGGIELFHPVDGVNYFNTID